MIRIAVCDDTGMELEFLSQLLQKYGQAAQLQLDIARFESGEALEKALGQGESFDIFFLDIIMPGMDGLSLAKTLRRSGRYPVIIFLTSSDEYAVEAFAIRASDYLVKPVSKERLFNAMDGALAEMGSKLEPSTEVQTPDYTLRVKLSEVIVVEVQGHTLCYRLTGNRQLHTKVLRIPFEQAAKDILADRRFLRPHRSFLVNAAHVVKLEKYAFLMSNEERIPISRLRFAAVRQEYADYLSEAGDWQ